MYIHLYSANMYIYICAHMSLAIKFLILDDAICINKCRINQLLSSIMCISVSGLDK